MDPRLQTQIQHRVTPDHHASRHNACCISIISRTSASIHAANFIESPFYPLILKHIRGTTAVETWAPEMEASFQFQKLHHPSHSLPCCCSPSCFLHPDCSVAAERGLLVTAAGGVSRDVQSRGARSHCQQTPTGLMACRLSIHNVRKPA